MSELLSKKQINDEEDPKKIKKFNLLFASTGISEKFFLKKKSSSLQALIDSIEYVQNKYVWIKRAWACLRPTKPKLSMEECKIAGTTVNYGIAKGSGMIHPDMATTLGLYLQMPIV